MNKLIIPLLLLIMHFITNYVSAQNIVLSSVVTKKNIQNGIPTQVIDSYSLYYSGSRGGSVTRDNYVYDLFNSTALFDSAVNTVNQFYTKQIITRTYDNNNNVLTNTMESFNNATPYQQKRVNNTYDNNNRLISTVFQYGSSGSWQQSAKDSFVYDNQGNLTMIYKYKWDNVSSWDITHRIFYTYNGSGMMTSDYKQYYTKGTQKWTTTDTNTYTYNSSMRLTGINNYTSSGVLYLTTVYTYTTNGMKETELKQWPTTALKRRDSFAYNNMQLIYHEFQDWDKANQVWKAPNKYKYSYSSSGNILEVVQETWNTGTSSYFVSAKTTDVSELNQFSYTYKSDRDTANNTWSITYDTTVVHHYENGTTSVMNSDNTNAVNIKLYPNPVSGSVLNITINRKTSDDIKLTLLSMEGRIIRQLVVDENIIQIPIIGIKSGNYFIQFSGAGIQKVMPFVIND